MPIELDRRTFRGLVWLNVVAFVASIVAFAPQFIIGQWYEFGLAFDVLVEEKFGPEQTPLSVFYVLGVAFAACAVWAIASTIGLLWFYRWARFGFWASMVVLMILSAGIIGFRPVYASLFDNFLSMIASAFFGTVVLLSYAKDYGEVWFGSEGDKSKD